MADPLPLIATKFHIPPARADLVARPRLAALLENGARQPLTLVSAPPGFGKTMLVADWVHAQVSARVAWLSLDEADSQPAIFWNYVIAALQRVEAEVGQVAQVMLGSPNPPAAETMLGMLSNELAALPAPLWLVVDDYHLIRSAEIHKHLRFFLDHQPAAFHLMLLTREDPPLDLARRRARRQMVEIRAADLRFTAEEGAQFLKGTMGLALTAEQVTTLERRTEGWIVGLQMAALSLQGRDPQTFFRSFKGDDRFIADYLIEEVLQRQPEPVRAFLLKTSILERMCTGLCEAVAGAAEGGAAGSILEHLDRANLFVVPLDNRREWYRYHHLFAELLRQHMAATLPAAELARLHRLAADWFEAHHDIPLALRHIRQIPDAEREAALLQARTGEFFYRGELLQLCELANALSPAQREAHPVLSMGVAWAAVATGQPVEPWLQSIEQHFALKAEAALEAADLDPARRAALLEVLIVREQTPFALPQPENRARLLAIRRHLEAMPPDQNCLFNVNLSLKPVVAFDLGMDAEKTGEADLAARAFDEAIALARETHNSHLYHLALAHLAAIQMAQSHLQAARQTNEQALVQEVGLVQGASPYVALAHAGLGALHYEWGDLPAAERHFAAGLPLARSWNHWESLIPLALGRARLAYRRGDRPAALDILAELTAPPVEGLLQPLEARRAIWEAEAGQVAAAGRWLAASGLSADSATTPFNESLLIDVARLLTVLDRPAESVRLARAIVAAAEAGGRTHTVIQGHVILAKALAAQRNLADAQTALAEALRLAEPEGYLSTFVDEGEPLRRLLGRWVEDEHKNYVERILAGFGGAEEAPARREPPAGTADLLSDREREVLGLMAAGLSNQEIAERLVISITTVKTHIGNIFNKLGVTSRTQALARAEALRLLPRR